MLAKNARVLCIQPRTMCDKAVAWCKNNKGHFRVNSVHGEEELYLILSETFSLKESECESTEKRGSMEVEVGGCKI